jgi:hypothetical protein
MIETDKKDTNIGELQSVDLSEKEVPKLEELSPDCAGPVGGPVSGAFEINRIFYQLPPELLRELDRVLSVEEQEHAVLVQAMIEEADKWARGEIGKIKGESNNKVRTFISLENSDIQDARRICKEDKKRAKTNTKKEMKVLQEKLTEFLKLTEDTLEADLAAIRARFKDIYKRVEDESKTRVSQTMASVADFTHTLQGLTLEQLQVLKQSGVLRLGGEQVSVPGVVQPEEEDGDI